MMIAPFLRRVAMSAALVLLPSLALADDKLEQRLGPAALQMRQRHAAVDVMTLGNGSERVYVFTPAQPVLHDKVPLVLLHHGWQGMNTLNFGALIDHLVRSGNVVVYPVYQLDADTSPQVVTRNAALADQRALNALKTRRGLRPDPQRVLYVGYSMGAAISLNLALDHARYQLPAPRALVLEAPGDAYHVAHGADARSIIGDVEKLPADLPVAILTGSSDTSIGLPTARKLAARLCQIRADRRVLMVLPSDEHGGKKVHAAHGSPGAPDQRYDFALKRQDIPTQIPGRAGFEASPSFNQLDIYGYWKVIDAMTDTLATGKLSDAVFGNGTPAQLYLGTWPDGTPYAPARVEQACR
ncbi:alpha/beta hydrolase family protein [Dyella sp.]|uniref:alpha/beta hydrolase family protein n=1 Tax=Dyella sp. TaxID=1869338 RepID=UPI002ED3D4C1